MIRSTRSPSVNGRGWPQTRRPLTLLGRSDGLYHVTTQFVILQYEICQDGHIQRTYQRSLLWFGRNTERPNNNELQNIENSLLRKNNKGHLWLIRINLIRAWISNHLRSWVWGGVIYLFPNVNGCTDEVWEWMINFILHFITDVMTDPCWEKVIRRGPVALLAHCMIYFKLYILSERPGCISIW